MHSKMRNAVITAAAQIISSGLSVGEISQKGTKFKLQRGDGTEEGSLDPSRKGDFTEGTPRWGCPRHRMSHIDFLPEFHPFPAMVRGQKHDQGKGLMERAVWPYLTTVHR